MPTDYHRTCPIPAARAEASPYLKLWARVEFQDFSNSGNLRGLLDCSQNCQDSLNLSTRASDFPRPVRRKMSRLHSTANPVARLHFTQTTLRFPEHGMDGRRKLLLDGMDAVHVFINTNDCWLQKPIVAVDQRAVRIRFFCHFG